jgi:thrombospondin type 3 repeat protein
MRGRNFVRILGSLLALAALLASVPHAQAAVANCTATDGTDPPGDVASNPNVVPNQLNGFDRLDILSICFTETADAVLVVVTVGDNVGSDQLQSYTWTFHYTPGSGAAATIQYKHAGGTPSSTPAGGAESSGTDKIQFTLLKSAVPPGTALTALSVESSGQYLDQAAGVITGSDKAPNAGSFPFTYKAGARAPPGTDTDKDGIDDATEVARGSDPSKADSDGDGLSDADEQKAGSNATKADTDGDGLTDAEEVSGSASVQGSTVAFTPTDPTKDDTDGDGLPDRDELTAAQNSLYAKSGYLPTVPGSTDPTKRDSDGDDLSDGEELAGSALIDGQRVSFSPTDPNDADTDNDGLTDLEEVRGYRITQSGQRVEFGQTDPTKDDTDGDGVSDFKEVQTHHDPADASDKPETGPVSDVAQYLPVSGALLLLVVFVSLGGILWRWA